MDKSWKNWTWNRIHWRPGFLNSISRRRIPLVDVRSCLSFTEGWLFAGLARKNLTKKLPFKGQYQQMTKAREMGLFPWHDSVCVFNYSGCFGRCLFESFLSRGSILDLRLLIVLLRLPKKREIPGSAKRGDSPSVSFFRDWLVQDFFRDLLYLIFSLSSSSNL